MTNHSMDKPGIVLPSDSAARRARCDAEGTIGTGTQGYRNVS
jgi:hypothetical protein